MKIIFLLLFFLSSFAYAEFVEIDSNRSRLFFQEKNVVFSGFIDRDDSKLEVDSDELSISGTKFSSGDEYFEVEGILTFHGETRGTKLYARDLGNSNYHLKNSELDIQIIGLKTKEEKNELVNRIREIVK